MPGAKVYFYKPPSQADTQTRGRKVKHLDHYIGPAIIVRQVGSRSFIIRYTDKKGVEITYQRDAAMLSLVPPNKIIKDLSDTCMTTKAPHMHCSLVESPIEEGEVILLKDGCDASTWYCAQILEKLPDRIKVSYFTTENSYLRNFGKSTLKDRCKNLKTVSFHKTWTLSDGSATTVAPEISKKKSVLWLWTGQIPFVFLDDQLLVRNV
jgi:hypothetical protein